MKYILASASPRRHELLKLIIPEFMIFPADIDETLPDEINIFEAAEFLACKKAVHSAERFPGSVVIGCDTVVIADGNILGKPEDEKDAKRMLSMLSGRRHYVVTGVCIISGGQSTSFSEQTEVNFYSLTDEEINGYIATNEPFDKAGAYGIQEKGALLVKEIAGDFYNVMGLPVARLNRELARLFKNS